MHCWGSSLTASFVHNICIKGKRARYSNTKCEVRYTYFCDLNIQSNFLKVFHIFFEAVFCLKEMVGPCIRQISYHQSILH